MLQGYVLQDEAGILGVVPDAQPTEEGRKAAMNYVKKNKTLEVLDGLPDEDWIELTERVQKRVRELQEKKRLSTN